MDELLSSLLTAVPKLSEGDLELLLGFLVQTFSELSPTSAVRIVDSLIDVTGAAPGIYCKLAGADHPHLLDVQWHALLSLNGYDNDDGSWSVNCCAHVVVFIQKSRVKTERGPVIRYSLAQEAGVWQWRCEGWVEDEHDEFEGEVCQDFEELDK